MVDNPGIAGDNESFSCRCLVVRQDTAARYYREGPAAALKKLIKFWVRWIVIRA